MSNINNQDNPNDQEGSAFKVWVNLPEVEVKTDSQASEALEVLAVENNEESKAVDNRANLANDNDLSVSTLSTPTVIVTLTESNRALFKHSGKQLAEQYDEIDLKPGIKSLYSPICNILDLKENVDYIYTKDKNKVDIFLTHKTHQRIKAAFDKGMTGRKKQKFDVDKAMEKDLRSALSNDYANQNDSSLEQIENTGIALADLADFIPGAKEKENNLPSQLEVEEMIKSKPIVANPINLATKQDIELLTNQLLELQNRLGDVELISSIGHHEKQFKTELNNEIKSFIISTINEVILAVLPNAQNTVSKEDFQKFKVDIVSEINSLAGKYSHLTGLYDKLAKTNDRIEAISQDAMIARYQSVYNTRIIENQANMLVSLAQNLQSMCTTMLNPHKNFGLTLDECNKRAKLENTLFTYPEYTTINNYLKAKKLEKHIPWKLALNRTELALYGLTSDPQLPYRQALARICLDVCKTLKLDDEDSLVYIAEKPEKNQKARWDNQKLYHSKVLDRAIEALYEEFDELKSENPNHMKYLNLKPVVHNPLVAKKALV